MSSKIKHVYCKLYEEGRKVTLELTGRHFPNRSRLVPGRHLKVLVVPIPYDAVGDEQEGFPDSGLIKTSQFPTSECFERRTHLPLNKTMGKVSFSVAFFFCKCSHLLRTHVGSPSSSKISQSPDWQYAWI